MHAPFALMPPSEPPGRAAEAVAPETLVAFLSDPASYPHGPDHVELLQTHISYVALAPPLVYKVKKPVALGFLDFSTLARRRHFCEEEVRLNRRLCAQIYRRVVPITLHNGQLVWGGSGEPVEVAVEMDQLDAEGFLDARIERGFATPNDLDRVAEKLAAFYQSQTPAPETAVWGRPARLRISTDENFAQTERFAGDLLSRPAFEALRAATDQFLDGQARLLHRRRAEGRVVDGHGDLRAEHVHFSDAEEDGDGVCIFDCIEFNERFRYIDLANDVAFLTMDLDALGRPDLARHFATRMAARLDDPDLLTVLDFYKGYRAYVRGKVEAMRSTEAEVPPSERAASRDRARRDFQLALRYAVAGSTPLVVAVMGDVGTGKSTQARALGEALGWEVVSSDRVRKEAAGAPLFERGSKAERAALYAPERTEATYAVLRERALRAAREGRGIVLDATFGARRQRDALREALRAAGIGHRFIELSAPEEVVRRRLAARETADDVASDARLEDLAMLMACYQTPDALEDAEHVIVETDDDPEETTRAILLHLVRLSAWP
jgi:aminoglycoside phosphotransferase family enzyme/predicted kinase